ncbi:MAG: hypothetical protein KBE09_02680 [Candidatus Pacebacteria bacterium]|nr:hypothetical protein [Candidatus Paceibacterota bacterium]
MSSEIPYVLGQCPTCTEMHATRFVGFPNRDGKNPPPQSEECAYLMGQHRSNDGRDCAGSHCTPQKLVQPKTLDYAEAS